MEDFGFEWESSDKLTYRCVGAGVVFVCLDVSRMLVLLLVLLLELLLVRFLLG